MTQLEGRAVVVVGKGWMEKSWKSVNCLHCMVEFTNFQDFHGVVGVQ